MSAFFRRPAAYLQNPYIALIFFTALAFDFINGFHDAANSIATVVGTRVLRPFQAVSGRRGGTLRRPGLVGCTSPTPSPNGCMRITSPSMSFFAGLLGAIVWNLITWYGGLPSSSSHALLGGFGGAAIVHAGQVARCVGHEQSVATVEYIVIAPLIGYGAGLGVRVHRDVGLSRVSAHQDGPLVPRCPSRDRRRPTASAMA